MRYIFFGTPDFAAIILEKLIKAGLPPLALVCNPDRPVGRKKIITPPPAKEMSRQSNGIKILQPEKLDQSFLTLLKELNADFYIVAAYAKILKKELIEIPPLRVIGVHPSLLPKYRGASPIQTALLNCESETGVDLFMIDEKVDNGPILASQKIEIKNKNYKELERELAKLAGDMLIEVLPKFTKGEIKPVPQNDAEATYTKKFLSEDGYIAHADLAQAQTADKSLALSIEARVRALGFEPGVYTLKNSKRIKILKAHLEAGLLKVSEIQPEGKLPSSLTGLL